MQHVTTALQFCGRFSFLFLSHPQYDIYRYLLLLLLLLLLLAPIALVLPHDAEAPRPGLRARFCLQAPSFYDITATPIVPRSPLFRFSCLVVLGSTQLRMCYNDTRCFLFRRKLLQ